MRLEDGMGNLPGFDSVQEFLASNATHGRSFKNNRRFFGTLRKDTISGEERTYSVLKVTHIVNRDRTRNWRTSPDPPQRTGLLEAFMDEVENSSREAGFEVVWIDLVATEFLRPKFVRRGYQPIQGDGNPCYAKFLPTPE